MKDSRIFVTGGCGFIGANLVKYLLDKYNYDITVYDNLSASSRENLDRAILDSKQKGTVNFIKGDILDKDRLEEVVKGCNAIIHLAAHTRVIESLENPRNNFEINAIGTFNVLEAARKNKIEKFILASSNAAVGEQGSPINEKMIPKPISPYGASKLTGESLCSAYYHCYGIKTVSLRFANVYGPYSEHKTSVVAKFMRRAKQGKPLEIYGDGNQTRDFIHAQDVCQAIYLSLNPKLKSPGSIIDGEIFQIATGKETSINDLFTKMRFLMEKDLDHAITPKCGERRRGEIVRSCSDISKSKQALGYIPNVALDNGLEYTWKWFWKKKAI